MTSSGQHGFTKSGIPVHRRTIDHHPDGFNKLVAGLLTKIVGTMWCFWVFNGIAIVSLPTAIRTGNPTVIVNWVSSNWIQLVLLPALMVGQKLQGDAADARAIKTFEDTERLLDLMDVRTEGGLKEILDAVKAARS